jgi:CRISPR-associated protein Csx10
MIFCYLPYTLSLHAPAVLTSLGGDPNSSRTLPYIPGSALRGAAARGLGDPGDDPGRRETFRQLILDGTVRFLNAYPRAGGRRTLPTPVSLRADKNLATGPRGALTAWDLAAFGGESTGDGERWPEASLAEVPEPFVSIGAAQPLRVSAARGSRIHQQRDRARGRAWTDPKTEEPHGTIFAFEFLEAGQEFDGLLQILGEDDATCDALAIRVKEALRCPVLVGRSRRGGYGGDATISWRDPQNREVLGHGIIFSDVPGGTEFRALLASAYVGRDPETGQLDPAHLASEIADRLRGCAEVVHRRWRFELVGGFNRKWRLEIPQALGCAAGSVLVLKATSRIPFADLLAVEHGGLGERRVEGLGRVVFLEARPRTLVLRAPSPVKPQAPDGDPPELVRFAEARIVEAAVDRVIQEEAARLTRSPKAPPSASLLGRLRNAMRAEPKTALTTLETWLAPDGHSRERLKRPAMDQLERCRIADGQRLSTWLRAMAAREGDQDLAALLRLDAVAQRSHIVSEATAGEFLAGRDAALRARLVDATLTALALKQRQRRST